MINIGVFGAGHLGKIHLKLLREIDDFHLIGFHDPDPKVAAEVYDSMGIKPWDNPEELLNACDAVDIVTPTVTHHEVARQAMRKFRHIFIEKPIANSLEEADNLVNLAREAGVKAQVGHVERFNPAFLALKKRELNPLFVESHRLAQWNPRGTDVSVVLDLMIHDIDIVLNIIKSPIKRISASGVAVVSDTPDIANARIEFNNGAVANLTASRISFKNMRKMRIFQKSAYLTVDFLEKKTEIFNIADEEEQNPDPAQLKFQFQNGDKIKFLTFETPKVEPVNAIKMELEEFARAINEDGTVRVSLEEGAMALRTAHQILEKINNLCVT